MKASTQFHTTHLFLIPVLVSVPTSVNTPLTRMHSSRMHAARLLPISPSMHCSGGRGCTCLGVGRCTCLGCICWGCTCLGGVSAQGGVPAGGCTCQAGVYLPRGVCLPRGREVYLPRGCTCRGYLPREVYLPGGVPAQVLPHCEDRHV